MKCGKIILVAAGLLSSALAGALADDGKVIANSSVKEDVISAAELKSVFLEEKRSLADGIHVEPVLEKDGPVHEWFLREYLGRTDDDLQTYYRVLVFTGRGSIPKNLGSDAERVRHSRREAMGLCHRQLAHDRGSKRSLRCAPLKSPVSPDGTRRSSFLSNSPIWLPERRYRRLHASTNGRPGFRLRIPLR